MDYGTENGASDHDSENDASDYDEANDSDSDDEYFYERYSEADQSDGMSNL